MINYKGFKFVEHHNNKIIYTVIYDDGSDVRLKYLGVYEFSMKRDELLRDIDRGLVREYKDVKSILVGLLARNDV